MRAVADAGNKLSRSPETDLRSAAGDVRRDGPSRPTAGSPRIAFGSVRNGGNHDVFLMDLDGGNQVRLTNNPAYDDEPKWSPDGSKILFISDRDGNFEIYTMNADGSGQTRITNNPAADGFPAWSHDGTKIAFVRGDLRNPSTFEIFVMNANGSNQIRLTNDSAIDGVPSWSPDSTKIVFMSGGSSVFDSNSFEIFVMNAADGDSRARLTNNTIVDGQPSYSPDGTRILFASAENSTLKQQELNKAFVLMQYFGYLRRNPFDPPEPTLDFQGYNFWLNKLIQFNGNFVNAEMVKAFIVSGEYRLRFGP